MLTMTSRFPSGRTMANDPSKVPDFCSVRYQNVESRNGSPSFTMTTASMSSLAFEMSLSALDLGMPSAIIQNYIGVAMGDAGMRKDPMPTRSPRRRKQGMPPAFSLVHPQMPIHSFLTILLRAEMADIAARYEVLGLSGEGTLNVWQVIWPNSPLTLSS